MTASETATSSDLSARIVKQLEFYFGDANLPRDKFLREKVSATPEGWVALETVMAFGRMQKLTTDAEVVRAALVDSKALALSEDGTRIRRVAPLPADVDAEAGMARGLYVQGLPCDASLDDIEAFFARTCEAAGIAVPAAIRMRREADKSFKGAAFVEMPTAEAAAALLAHATESPLSYAEGVSVEVRAKADYFDAKNASKMARNAHVTPAAAKHAARRAALLERMGAGRLVKARTPAPADVSHEAIKTALAETFPVAFVDAAATHGEPGVWTWIRFREPVAAAFVEKHGAEGVELADGVKLGGFELPDVEEQAAYYDASQFAQRGRSIEKRRSHDRRGGPAAKVSRTSQ